MLTDFGKFQDLNSTQKIYGIGSGYQFKANNTLVNLSYTVGKINSQKLDVKQSKISLNLTTFF